MDRPPTSALRERLKAETRAQHDAAERATRIADRTSDVRDYVPLVARLFGFYEAAEARLAAAHGGALAGLRLEPRRRAPLLRRDLHALGLSAADIEALPRCADLPDTSSPPAALGYLYVVEGSSLGGTLIARQLAARLGLRPETGAAFFSIYGDQVGARWHEFLTALTAAPVEAADAVVAAARDTFARFTRWVAEEPV